MTLSVQSAPWFHQPSDQKGAHGRSLQTTVTIPPMHPRAHPIWPHPGLFSDECLSQPADQTREQKKVKVGMVGQQEQSIAQLLFLPPTFAKIAKVFLTTTFIQLGTKKQKTPKKASVPPICVAPAVQAPSPHANVTPP